MPRVRDRGHGGHHGLQDSHSWGAIVSSPSLLPHGHGSQAEILGRKRVFSLAAPLMTDFPFPTRCCYSGIVFNITGGSDLTLQEVNRISEVVTSLADPSCNIIFGAVVDDRYTGEIHVTIIATGRSVGMWARGEQ